MLALIGMTAGCTVTPQRFGYLQFWSDRTSYGDPALYFERVRIDMPQRVQPALVISSSSAAVPSPAEQTQSPIDDASVANAIAPEGTWLFH